MAQTKLSPVTAKAIKTILEFVRENLVSKIDVEYANIAANVVINKLKETADILADVNANDKEQLKLVWGSFFADHAIAESVRLAFLDAVTKINNDEIKEGLTLLIDPLTETLVALSDENLANADQLEQIWLRFVQSERFIDFIQKNLKSLLSKFIKNEFLLDFLVSLLDLVKKD